MKILPLLTLFFFLINCNLTKSELTAERKAWGFENWSNEFKDRAFCLCLLKGYESKSLENAILKIDKSYYNGVGIAIFDPTLKPIIARELVQIKLDSAESARSVGEAAVGKRIFDHCLNFYKSRRLDSITKREISKWNKIQSIEEEVLRAIPSY